jgi:hypothetical protein
MTEISKTILTLTALMSIQFTVSAKDFEQTCMAEKWTDSQVVEFKANQFSTADTKADALAIDMLPCLANPNPKIRDGIAYEAYSHWLREEKVTIQTTQKLFNTLTDDIRLSSGDENGFYISFAILVYSEVIRVDRVKPYLTEQQRQTAVDVISQTLLNMDDYRGFNDAEGWRHKVAHAADVVLQLSLNPNLTDKQAQQLSSAIAKQVAPSSHSYVFGESKRLAMPMLYLYFNGKLSLEQTTKWLNQVASSQPFASWGETYQSEQGLTKRHNTKLFLMELFTMVSSSKNEKLSELKKPLLTLLKGM